MNDKSNFTDKMKTDRPLSLYLASFSMNEEDLQNLNGKKILLIGGGKSPIAKNLRDLGISAHVVNIDPFTKSFSADNSDELISKSFFESDFKNDFDEVWASYSLPAYSKNNYEEISFWIKAIHSLNVGGKLRVSGFGNSSEYLGIDYESLSSLPSEQEFIGMFNSRFAKSKIEHLSEVFVIKTDSSVVKSNSPSVKEYFELLEAALKKQDDYKRSEKTEHAGEVRIKQKKQNGYLFVAPDSKFAKAEIDVFLESYLNDMKKLISRNDMMLQKQAGPQGM